MEAIKCPEHGEKCIVTMPNRKGVTRLRCSRDMPCVDARYEMPSCAVNGHVAHVKIVSIDADGTVCLACSRCKQYYILYPTNGSDNIFTL